ncbi:MAG: hypothetical protein AAF363_04205 [Bacteroidota bacterium]
MNKFLLIPLFLSLSFQACAQSSGKITIKITDETSGEKKTIEKSYNSRKEMFQDEELHDFDLFPHDLIVLDDSVKFDLPISFDRINELTEMASRLSGKADIVVSGIDVDINEEEIRAHVEKITEELSDFKHFETDHFRRKKPD